MNIAITKKGRMYSVRKKVSKPGVKPRNERSELKVNSCQQLRVVIGGLIMLASKPGGSMELREKIIWKK